MATLAEAPAAAETSAALQRPILEESRSLETCMCYSSAETERALQRLLAAPSFVRDRVIGFDVEVPHPRAQPALEAAPSRCLRTNHPSCRPRFSPTSRLAARGIPSPCCSSPAASCACSCMSRRCRRRTSSAACRRCWRMRRSSRLDAASARMWRTCGRILEWVRLQLAHSPVFGGPWPPLVEPDIGLRGVTAGRAARGVRPHQDCEGAAPQAGAERAGFRLWRGYQQAQEVANKQLGPQAVAAAADTVCRAGRVGRPVAGAMPLPRRPPQSQPAA